MIAYCSYIPDVVWVREVENGMRHITLRRNFTEETVTRQEGEETQFRFEETDVFILDRENIHEFITSDFSNLFDFGLQQMEQVKQDEEKIQKTRQLIDTGQIVQDLDSLQEQVLLILGV